MTSLLGSPYQVGQNSRSGVGVHIDNHDSYPALVPVSRKAPLSPGCRTNAYSARRRAARPGSSGLECRVNPAPAGRGPITSTRSDRNIVRRAIVMKRIVVFIHPVRCSSITSPRVWTKRAEIHHDEKLRRVNNAAENAKRAAACPRQLIR